MIISSFLLKGRLVISIAPSDLPLVYIKQLLENQSGAASLFFFDDLAVAALVIVSIMQMPINYDEASERYMEQEGFP